jgi:hypothetical protein
VSESEQADVNGHSTPLRTSPEPGLNASAWFAKPGPGRPPRPACSLSADN